MVRSSAEAKFRSMASAVAELTWLTGLYKELCVKVHLPNNLYCDSKSSIQIAANPISHERTKHIDIDYHFVGEIIFSRSSENTTHLHKNNRLIFLLKA